jgi:hypothetical protein
LKIALCILVSLTSLDPTVLTKWLEDLLDILMENDTPLDSKTRDCIVIVATEILNEQLDHEDILKIALCILGSLTSLAGRNVPTKTVKAVVNAMHGFLNSSKFQAAACETLSILAWYSSANKTTIVGAGGIEALVLAMWEFPRDSKVQNVGCRAFGYLSGDHKSVSAAPPSSGNLAVVVTSTPINPGGSNIQKYAFHALRHCPIDHLANSDLNTCTIEAVVVALREYPHDSNIQRYGCCALIRLLSVPHIKRRSLQPLVLRRSWQLCNAIRATQAFKNMAALHCLLWLQEIPQPKRQLLLPAESRQLGLPLLLETNLTIPTLTAATSLVSYWSLLPRIKTQLLRVVALR